jgi:hypothetical protein
VLNLFIFFHFFNRPVPRELTLTRLHPHHPSQVSSLGSARLEHGMKQASAILSSAIILAITNSAGSCGTLAVVTPATILMISTQLPVPLELLSLATVLTGHGVGDLWKALEANAVLQM